MLSLHISRFRAAIILAVTVFVWSDAALASFVCPHMSGCEHGMPAQGHQHSRDAQAAEPMPCCPLNSESSTECAASVMECCSWHRSESDQTAILFASDHPRTKQVAAVLPATIPATPSLIAWAHSPGLASDLLYAKPVDQKKTDLRI